MSNQYKAVAAVLHSAITSTNSILTSPEDEMHRIRITQQLQLLTDQLLLITGTGDLQTGQTAVLGPATTIGGKPIGKVRKFTADDMIPSDDKVYKLKKEIESAVTYFGPEANAAGILANIPELIIRGVAKKAGLKVTRDVPKELTVEFIEQVKKALVDNGITGVVNDDDDEEEEIAAETFNETHVGEVTVDEPKPSDILSKERFEGVLSNLLKAGIQAPETKSIPAETIPPVDETKASVDDGKEDQATDEEAAEFGANAAKDLFEMVKDVKTGQTRAKEHEPEKNKSEEPKQEQKPKPETDPKKKTGK